MTMTTAHSREVQHRLLKEIDLWSSGVFVWLDRAKIGTTLAPISARFDLLVDAHFGANRTMGRLEIWRALHGDGPELVNRLEDGFYKKLPIPLVPPPANFVGFKSIFIRYIDGTVVAFLHRIRRLFRHAHIALKLVIWPQSVRAWHTTARHIWPLLGPNVCRLSVDSYVFPRLRQFVSPSVLCDCVNLCQVESDGIFPEGTPDDHPRASHGQALSKWLHMPREDGRPKLLNVNAWTGQFHAQIEQLKGDLAFSRAALLRATFLSRSPCSVLAPKAFLTASSPVSYAIRLLAHQSSARRPYVPFVVDNDKTRERLTFRRIDKGDARWLLRRAPLLGICLVGQQRRQHHCDNNNDGGTDCASSHHDEAVVERCCCCRVDWWRWTTCAGVSAIRVQFEDGDIGPLSAK